MSATRFTRRRLLQSALAAVPAAALSRSLLAQNPADPLAGIHIAPGPFKPTWESLKAGYKAPDWFRDAKFGVWNHWTAQCVPEQGDWYARNMYMQGNRQYDHHLKTYGHPSKDGWMEMNNRWKAENWKPAELMNLYVKAGAKYFSALANHHDNFDNYNSRFHNWNSVKLGPKKDIVGIYTKLAREHGLRVAVTNHASHAWHWLQTAYDYDPEGTMAGQRYDAYTLTKADGKGKWWEGFDPQELYTGRNLVMPDGLTLAEANAFHKANDGKWHEEIPAMNREAARNWFLRTQDLIDTYKPDLVYYDDTELPFEEFGLATAAHLYNSSIRDKGHQDAVMTGKGLRPDHVGAITLDIERGKASSILADPWQTDTCIGDWHYNIDLFQNHKYKTPKSVIHSLIDIVSKNGNLMLNIPLKGDGTMDSDERAFLEAISTWIPKHGEAIYGTRPFAVFGEGAPDVTNNNNFNENHQRAYTAEDIRFTRKGDTVYAFGFVWPENRKYIIKTLASGSSAMPKPIQRVELIGGGPIKFTQEPSGLTLNLPDQAPNEYAYAFIIRT
ncbi:MAG: alpha-L-fucosidase [Acidobacteriota bacterium]|nr:alpha-L-fucosidase [Acidobacteriota bacterium]